MVAGALTGRFEWLYPLRFFAAAEALGAGVFILWIGLDGVMGSPVAMAMPVALSASSAAPRITWISFLVLAATVTVPIAEELAFRGFLLRRLHSQDFESVPFHTVHVVRAADLLGAVWRPAWPPLVRGNSSRAAVFLRGNPARQDRGSGGRPCDDERIADRVRPAVRCLAPVVTVAAGNT